MPQVKPIRVLREAVNERQLVRVEYDDPALFTRLAPARARLFGRRLQEMADEAEKAEDAAPL